MIRRILWTSLLLAALAGIAVAQPPRYCISGRVVNAVNGQPLAGAVISIGLSSDQNTTLQQILTGADGAFTFPGLEANKYWLAGTKPEFRKQAFEEHLGYFSGIAVGPGKDSSGLVFRMHPSAAISGTITNDESEAVPGAEVLLFYEEAGAATPQVFLYSRESADVHGEYHFDALPAGRYYLAVSALPWYSALLSRMQPQQGGAQAAMQSLMAQAYPVTFYPGGYDEASAAPLVLIEGQETVANLALSTVPSARLRIKVGEPSSDRSVTVELHRKVFNFLFEPQVISDMEDGAYLFQGLTVGRYQVLAQEFGPKARRPRALLLDLSGDLEMDIDATRAEAIRGSILGYSGPSRDVLVRLWNLKSGQMLDAPIEEGGTFVFPVAPAPGTYAVYVLGGPNSVVDSIAATHASVTGQSIVLSGAAPVAMKIQMSTVASQIEGIAIRNGKPEAGLMIVLVPDDAEHDAPKFRRDQSDSDGTFALRDVIPGHYRIVTLDDGWNREWMELAQDKVNQGASQEITVVPSSRQNVSVSVR